MSQKVRFLQAVIVSTWQELGQGLVEYALILLFIAILMIVSMTALSGVLTTSFYDRLTTELFP